MGKLNETVSSFVEYGNTSETLTLHKRSPIIRDIVKIANDKNYSISYKPVTLHFGSATVGGVTTGGAYTTGGYHYVSGTSNSGYYQFLFQGKLIKRIALDDELFALAKESEIAPYLDKKKHEIIVVEKVVYSNEQIASALSNYKTTGYVGNIHKGYPDLEKSIKILSWICDLEDEPDLVLTDNGSKIGLTIGTAISLGFLGLSCASFLMMLQGQSFDAPILLTAIIIFLLGGLWFASCMSSIMHGLKRKKKIKDRIKRSRA